MHPTPARRGFFLDFANEQNPFFSFEGRGIKWPNGHFMVQTTAAETAGWIWWPEAESNCRHEDFQSSALPTELSGRGVILGALSVPNPARRCRAGKYWALVHCLDCTFIYVILFHVKVLVKGVLQTGH